MTSAENEREEGQEYTWSVYVVCMNNGEERKRVNISLTPDTVERLKRVAWENHTTVSQAITDWIWSAKVKNDQIRGQISFQDKRSGNKGERN